MPDSHTQIHAEQVGQEEFHRLSELISARKQADPFAPVTVVAPTQYAGVFLRRALAAERGLLNVRFMILPRLAEYLGSPVLAQKGKVPLTPLVELATIRYIATESKQDGPLRAVSHHAGLPGLLRRSFRDLSRLDENDLVTLTKADDLRSQLVDWYRKFKTEIQGYYVQDELIRVAEEGVRKSTVTDVLRDIGYVVFYFPNDLSRTESRLVRSLAEADQAAVVLGMVGESEIDEDTYLIATSISGGSKLVRTDEDSELNLPVKLLSAPDSREEIRWVVRDIARRCEGGTPFYKIAVLYRQREPYSSLIPTQLALAGMPVAGPNQGPLKATPSGRSLLGMLAAMNTGLSRPEVMQWLSESPVRFGREDRDARGTSAEWETVSRRAGIVKGIGQWEERLDALGNRLTRQVAAAERLEEISPARLQGLRRMSTALTSLLVFIKEFSDRSTSPVGETWDGLAKWLKRLLENYSFSEDQLQSEHRAGHERLLGVLDEFEALDATSIPPTKEAFLEILDNLLEAPSGRLGETGSGVFVAPVETVKGMAFDAVYIVGMCEGDFPTAPPQDSVLPYEVRGTIGDGLVLDSQQTFRRKERRAFLTASYTGDDYILSYPRSDSSSQRPRFPSPWFMDALTALNGSSVSSNDIPSLGNETWLDVIRSPLHSLESVEALAPADIHDRDVASVSRWTTSGQALDDHYLSEEGSSLSRSIALGESRRSRHLTQWDGDVSDTSGIGSGLKEGPLSATGLESWARCPFSYFLGHVLGLRALDSPEDALTVSALDRGSLVHRILERFVDESIRRDKGSGDAAEQTQLARRIAEEEFTRAEAKGITGKPLLWATAKDEILRDLFGFLDEDRTWLEEHGLTPIWTEKSFGFEREDSLDPLQIVLKNGTELSFRGMIDRVDISEDKKRIFVTDYKTGSSYLYRDMNKDPLDSGRRLQLPIYALAAKRAFPEVEQSQGSYWFVTAGAHFERKTVELEEVEDRFNEVIEGISTGIQSGLFPANPGPQGQYGPENCRYCDFVRICPASKTSLWERKRDDPRLAPYTGLSSIPNDREDA